MTQKETSTTTKAWPWVDGEDRSEKEPLPLICPEDDRPAVRDLIEKHRIKIDKSKDRQKATAAAKGALAFRKARGLDERDIRKDWPGSECSHEGTRKYFNCIQNKDLAFVIPHSDRGVIMFAKWASFDQNRLVKEISVDEWPVPFITEWYFQTLDNTTRRTGRLTKNIRLVDLEGFSFSNICVENLKRDSRDAKLGEDFYPQLLQTTFAVNAPTVFYAIFKMFRPLFPVRFTEKIQLVNPKTSQSDLKEILRSISEEHLPMQYGGKHKGWPSS